MVVRILLDRKFIQTLIYSREFLTASIEEYQPIRKLFAQRMHALPGRMSYHDPYLKGVHTILELFIPSGSGGPKSTPHGKIRC